MAVFGGELVSEHVMKGEPLHPQLNGKKLLSFNGTCHIGTTKRPSVNYFFLPGLFSQSTSCYTIRCTTTRH